MEQITYLEEYEIGSVRKSIGYTIAKTDIVLHAGQAGDFFPHHMDAEFAKTTELGKRIAHGTFISSIAVGMTASPINSVVFSHGYNHTRFTHPAFMGGTIHVKIILKKEHKDPKYLDRGFIAEALEIFNQNGQLIMVCERIMSRPKKTADA